MIFYSSYNLLMLAKELAAKPHSRSVKTMYIWQLSNYPGKQGQNTCRNAMGGEQGRVQVAEGKQAKGGGGETGH